MNKYISITFCIASLVLLVLVGIFTFQKPIPAANAIPPKIEAITLNADNLFELVNEWRISEDRPAYIKDNRLCEIAIDRSDDIQLDEHQGLYDKYSTIPYVIQENLARDISEQEMLNGWLNSKPHAETLRKPYTYSCIACKSNYCSQIFSNL